jgi:hypothetical protein
MARQELTTNGLKLYRDGDGTHWLHLGENGGFCLENTFDDSEIFTEQVRLWVESQTPVSDTQ